MSYGGGGCSQFPVDESMAAAVSVSDNCISNDFQQIPPVAASSDDPRVVPLLNLSKLHQKMDLLQQFLSESIDQNTLLGKHQMDMVSTEISSAICQIFVNGAALISCAQSKNPRVPIQLPMMNPLEVDLVEVTGDLIDSSGEIAGKAPMYYSSSLFVAEAVEPVVVGLSAVQMSYSPAATKKKDDEIDDEEECELVELDAVELLAEHIHFCEICGKGFKRDANLRMHMRAHGNQFKTPEALTKPPDKLIETTNTRRKKTTRFSCPFVGCNRNKSHKKFRPLKSAICVKNHFKRSHCPKMFSCNRCNTKSFSVVADLKSHLKHCGEMKWRCSCGTTFSRKDKLFGHMTLFEEGGGHMPAITTQEIQRPPKETTIASAAATTAAILEEEEDKEETQFEEGESGLINGGLMDQGLLFDHFQQDYVFGSPTGLATGMDIGWFDL